MRFSLADAAEAIEGRLTVGRPDALVRGVSTDSRTVGEGELFIALRGESFDGHTYVRQALSRGAAAAVVEERWVALGDASGAPLLVVPDTLRALGLLARWWRRRHGAVVVGVTGSSGKTTTKEMAAIALGDDKSVLKNELNLNNEVGLPQTLLRLTDSHRYAVVEMGMRGPGEIAYLSTVAEPEIGLVTNIGMAHLGRLGSREAIAAAKGELLQALPETGLAVLPAEDEFLPYLKSLARCPALTFGLGAGAQVRGWDIRLTPEDSRFRVGVQGEEAEVHVPAPGRHNVLNALAALAVAHALKVDLGAAAARLSGFRPPALRSERLTLRQGATLISDVYNANPDSMAAALEMLAAFEGRKVAVLGDMLELGEAEVESHRQVGARVASMPIDCLVAVGPLSRLLADGALAAGMAPDRVRHFGTCGDAAAWLKGTLTEGDVVLIKGSRGMRMEAIVEDLKHG